MARRSNFIESNDNFREQNLRFVRNEFEDNVNQFFEGANPGGGNQQGPPRRDSLIVQPTPVGQTEAFRSSNLDARRKFLLELGANRQVAHSLAVRSLKVPDFNLRDFQRQRFRLSVELGDSRQGVVDMEVLRSIGESVEEYEQDLIRPRTPPPPRNIDWHKHSREESPEMDQRSRPRERREDGNFQGGPSGFTAQGEPGSEPYPRHQGASNGTFNNQNRRQNANQAQGREPNRKHPNARNNSIAMQQNQQRRNQHEFDQDTRNPNNRNPNQPGASRIVNQVEFHRNTQNAGPIHHNPNNRNARNLDPQEMNRNNGPPNRNFNKQPLVRNFPEVFQARAQNVDPVPMNRNQNRKRNHPNANSHFDGNQQEYNRNNRTGHPNDIRFQQNRYGNPDELNHGDFNPNHPPQNRQGPNRNSRNQNFDIRGQLPNFRGGPQNDGDFHDNWGPNPNDAQGCEDPLMDEEGDMGFGNPQPNQEQPVRPIIGRNYQRIVHDNQITICRTDLLDRQERGFAGDHGLNESFEEEDQRFPIGINVHHDRFRGHQRQDNFDRPGFRPRDGTNERFFNPNESSFEDHQMEEEAFNDHNSYGRGHNDRYLDDGEHRDQVRLLGHHRHFGNEGERERRDFSDHFDRSDNVRGGDSPRSSPRKHGVYRESNNPNLPRNQYQGDRGSGPVAGAANRRRNNSVDNARNGPIDRNARRTSPDRNMGRNTNPGGPKSNSQDANRRAPRNDSSGSRVPSKPQGGNPHVRGPNQNRSNSPTGLGRNSNSGAHPPSHLAKRNENPRAGQKRAVETSGRESQKRRRASKSPTFVIGGYSLPYIKTNLRSLPQPEGESYAVTFFEQQPNYNTNIYANENGAIDNHEESESDTESVDSSRSGIGKGGGKNTGRANKKIRMRLRKMWTKMYRERNYKDWKDWWKDFKWCGAEINKKLEKFGNINLQHRFSTTYRKDTAEQIVNRVLKAAHMGLEKNTNKVYHNMRSIFLLMSESFLNNLSVEHMAQVQDLIRGIPNHLWLYKIRSMIFLWKMIHDSLKTRTTTFVQSVGELKAVSRNWENPLFHWLAKQAFDELKAISEIAWPEHNKIYPKLGE